MNPILNGGALCAVFFTLSFLMPSPVTGQEPPLYQPLMSLNRQTRDLSDSENILDYYAPYTPDQSPIDQFEDRMRYPEDDYVRNDELGFQSYPVDYPGPRFHVNEYLNDNYPYDEQTGALNKRVLSSFRERMEREKSKEQREKLAELFLEKLQEEAENRNVEQRDYESNKDYIDMLEELWAKYRTTHHPQDAPIFVEEVKKRQIPIDYSTLGWSGVGYKKRTQPNDNELVFLKYPSHDVYDEDGSRHRYNVIKAQSEYPHRSEYVYAKHKRFPVTKRSSNYYNAAKAAHHKRGVNGPKKVKKDASGTDPKVAKDLSNIFGSKESKKYNETVEIMKEKKIITKDDKNMTKKSTPAMSTTTDKPQTTEHHHHKNTDENKPETTESHQKETDVSSATPNDEPLNIKKKSIDWSNYFGIDRRRKKSGSYLNQNEIDDDWLVKRYNSAVALAVKRSSEYPLNFFRNHDTKRDNYQPSETTTTNELDTEKSAIETTTKSYDKKLGDMDDKLKNIEDLIIDEALKYTGAHEGETDPKELQEVKDKVISRLAAAYSLEKMRRALSEFKTSLTTQKYAGKNLEIENAEEAEEAMKKKSRDSENCKGNCDEDFTSRSGNEIDADKFSDSLVSGAGSCYAIENRCRKLVTNGFGAVFYPICKWHQLCYLCGTDTGSSEELTACDMIFLSRAEVICQGDVVCQWAGRPAVNFLRDMQDNAPKELATHCENNTCDVAERVFNVKRR